MTSPALRRVAGWALVLGASGIFIDSWASWTLDAESPGWLVTVVAPGGLGNGSIGLIPAYLGVTVGMVGFLIVLHHRVTIPVAVFAGAGVIGMFVFWYSYPARATFGGVGSILIGVAILALPSWGRLASPLWVASGVMGIPQLVQPGVEWGPVASFTLLGAAVGVTGAAVLWDTRSTNVRGPSRDITARATP